jgi:hypothetical protein
VRDLSASYPEDMSTLIVVGLADQGYGPRRPLDRGLDVPRRTGDGYLMDSGGEFYIEPEEASKPSSHTFPGVPLAAQRMVPSEPMLDIGGEASEHRFEVTATDVVEDGTDTSPD